MAVYEKFIQNTKVRRIAVLLSLGMILYLMRSMLTLFFLTFIFTYLSYKAVQKIKKYLKLSTGLLVIIIYGLIILFGYFVTTKYVPVIVNQTISTIDSLINFYQRNPKDSDTFFQMIHDVIDQFNVLEYLKNEVTVLIEYIQNFGKVAIAAVMAFILSFFFLIEEKRTFRFSALFLKGELDWYFQDMHYFFEKFTNTFGVVIEAQFFIAFINTTLTTIALAILGFGQLPSLAAMIFILSLIPVAGVIISIIPLSFIAYSTGGINDVIIVLLIILAIHLVESYILNPKLMSSKTEIPIFYTFVILLVSEHYFGVWGLVMGIPAFTFFIDLLKIKSFQKVEKRPL